VQEGTLTPSAGDELEQETWRAHDNIIPGIVDFASALSGEPAATGYVGRVHSSYANSVGYAHTYVHSSSQQNVELWLTYNDGARVWLNGALVLTDDVDHRYNGGLTTDVIPDHEKLSVALQQGWNKLLIKVSQDSGDSAAGTSWSSPNTWKLGARFMTPAGLPASGLTYQLSDPGDTQPPTPTVAAPSISPNGGTFANSENVSITTSTADAEIRYTLNESTPTASSNLYTGSFNVTQTTTVKAIGLKSDMNSSPVVSATFTKAQPTPSSMEWLHVEGNRIVNESGDTVVLRGVNIENREWNWAFSHSIDFELRGIEEVTSAPPDGWGANLILLAVASGPINRNEQDYMQALDQLVAAAKANNAYTLLVYRYGEPNSEQPNMPDQAAEDAMARLGDRYKDEPAVIYGLQVEPHDVGWSTLLPRFTTMVDAIRDNHPDALIAVPGTQYSRFIHHALTSPVPRENLIYKTHPYDSWTSIQNNYQLDEVAESYPVLLGEFGPGSFMNLNDVDLLLDYADDAGLSWAAWLFQTVGCPCLLTSTSTFATTGYGDVVKDRLQAGYVPTEPGDGDPDLITVPGRVEAEDYREGGPFTGYFDTTIGNSGGAYRDDNVDIEPTTDTGGGFNVSYISAGEWLAYDIEVEEDGVYDFVARVASESAANMSLTIHVDNVNRSGPMSFSGTGGWQNWVNLTASGIELDAGQHEMRIQFASNLINLNYLDVVVSDPDSNNPPNAAFSATPSTGEAPLAVQFNAGASTDSDGSISVYGWNFGDGSNGSGQVFTHTYNDAGNYQVVLTVTDDDGATDTHSLTIEVTEPVIEDVPTLTVESTEIDLGEIASVDVVLSDAPDGVAGFSVKLVSSNANVARIVSVTAPGLTIIEEIIQANGASVILGGLDAASSIQGGAENITLFTVEVEGVTEGVAALEFESLEIDDDSGFEVIPNVIAGEVAVVDEASPTVSVGGHTQLGPGETLTRQITISDADGNEWDASVDYGDGDDEQFSVTTETFNIEHTYGTSGVYEVAVVVTDVDGHSGSGSFVVFVQGPTPTLPGMEGPAIDLDGDGKAEDVNGNGRLDFADVVTLFLNIESDEVQDNIGYFDFNGNARADMADVDELFGMIVNED
jgi:PKD repeat protein